MMKHGPVDVLVLALGEPHFDGSILAELAKQASTGTIRVLDAMVLMKQADGRRDALNLEDLPAEMKASLGFIWTGTRGLLDAEDAESFYEGMVPGSAVIALAIEHTWAIDLVNTLAEKGVEVAMNVRIPAPVIDEAFASLENK